MKKVFSAISIFAFFVLLSCNNTPGKSGDAIDLKFNLAKGDSYDYNMDMNMSMKGNINGQAMNVTNKMAMGYHFGVTGDSAGWKKISSTISRIAMNINAGSGVNINYDSDKPVDTSDMVNGTMGKVLGAMKGGEFTFTMNDKGQIGSVTGITEMMNKMMASVPNAGAMAGSMGSAFNEDNFKQNIQQAFGMYPSKPVKPGDTWTSVMNTNNAGMSIKMNNTYTLESVSGDNANIKVNSKITSPSGDSTVGINGNMTGTMKYDVPTGVPVDGDLDMMMNMNVNQGGQSMPMNMDIKMKITGKKS
jgi:hypothetical protein